MPLSTDNNIDQVVTDFMDNNIGSNEDEKRIDLDQTEFTELISSALDTNDANNLDAVLTDAEITALSALLEFDESTLSSFFDGMLDKTLLSRPGLMSLPGLTKPYAPPADYQMGEPLVYSDDNGDWRAIVFGDGSDYDIVEQPPGSGDYVIHQDGSSVIDNAKIDFLSLADEPSFQVDVLTDQIRDGLFDEGEYLKSKDLYNLTDLGSGFLIETVNVQPRATINLQNASADANRTLARGSTDSGVLDLLADLGERSIDSDVAKNGSTSQETLLGLSETYYQDGSTVDWPMMGHIASNRNSPAVIKTQVAMHKDAPLSTLTAVARSTDDPAILESIYENYAQRTSILPQMEQILSQGGPIPPEHAISLAVSEITLLEAIASNPSTPSQTLSDVNRASLEHGSVVNAVADRASDPNASEEELFAIATSDLITDLNVAQSIAANPNADHHTLITVFARHPDEPTILASITGGDSGLELSPSGRRLQVGAAANIVAGTGGETIGMFPGGLVALSPAVEAPTFGAALSAATPYAAGAALADATVVLGPQLLHRLDPSHPVNVSVNEVDHATTTLIEDEDQMWLAYEAYQMDRNDPKMQSNFIDAVDKYANAVGDLEFALLGVETFLNGHATLSSGERSQLQDLLNQYKPVLQAGQETADSLFLETEVAWTSPFDGDLPANASLVPFAEDLAKAYQSNPDQVVGYLGSGLATEPSLAIKLLDTLATLPNQSGTAAEINGLLFGTNMADGRALFSDSGPMDWEDPKNITEADIRTALDDLPDWGDAALLYRLDRVAQIHNEQKLLTGALTNVLEGMDPGDAGQALLHYEYMHISDPVGTASTADLVLDSITELSTSNPDEAGEILAEMADTDLLAAASLIQRASDLVDSTNGAPQGIESEIRLLTALSLNSPTLGQQVSDSVSLYDQWANTVLDETDTAGGATREVLSLLDTLEGAAPAINGILDGIAEIRNVEFATQMAFGIYQAYTVAGPAGAIAGIGGWAARTAASYGVQTMLSSLATQINAAPDPTQYPESHRLYNRLLGSVANQIVGSAIQSSVNQDPQVPVDEPGQVGDWLAVNFDQEQMQLFAEDISDFAENLGRLAAQWPGPEDNPVFPAIMDLQPEDQQAAVQQMMPQQQAEFTALVNHLDTMIEAWSDGTTTPQAALDQLRIIGHSELQAAILQDVQVPIELTTGVLTLMEPDEAAPVLNALDDIRFGQVAIRIANADPGQLADIITEAANPIDSPTFEAMVDRTILMVSVQDGLANVLANSSTDAQVAFLTKMPFDLVTEVLDNYPAPISSDVLDGISPGDIKARDVTNLDEFIGLVYQDLEVPADVNPDALFMTMSFNGQGDLATISAQARAYREKFPDANIKIAIGAPPPSVTGVNPQDFADKHKKKLEGMLSDMEPKPTIVAGDGTSYQQEAFNARKNGTLIFGGPVMRSNIQPTVNLYAFDTDENPSYMGSPAAGPNEAIRLGFGPQNIGAFGSNGDIVIKEPGTLIGVPGINQGLKAQEYNFAYVQNKIFAMEFTRVAASTAQPGENVTVVMKTTNFEHGGNGDITQADLNTILNGLPDDFHSVRLTRGDDTIVVSRTGTSSEGQTLDILDPFPLPQETFQTLLHNSAGPIGTSGIGSYSEAVQLSAAGGPSFLTDYGALPDMHFTLLESADAMGLETAKKYLSLNKDMFYAFNKYNEAKDDASREVALTEIRGLIDDVIEVQKDPALKVQLNKLSSKVSEDATPVIQGHYVRSVVYNLSDAQGNKIDTSSIATLETELWSLVDEGLMTAQEAGFRLNKAAEEVLGEGAGYHNPRGG